MKKLCFILFLFILANITGYAQVIFSNDTINVGEVKVLPLKPDGAAGYKLQSIEGELIKSFAGSSLAALLENSSSLYIKNYGAGGLASSSFRGMGSNHTEILWEGQRINNPMLGSSDFNTIPSFFIDKIDIYFGGNPKSFGNKGPGGAISFGSLANWKKGINIEYTQDLGSFSLYGEGLTIGFASHNMQYNLKAYTRSAINDFKYYTTSLQNEDYIRQDADENSRGILQEIYYKNGGSIFSAKLWYNMNDRNLPGAVNVAQPLRNEQQYDESLRGIIKYKLYKGALNIDANVSYISNWLNYTNHLLSVDSKNKSNRYSAQLLINYTFNKEYKLRAGISATNTVVSSNNYTEIITRNKQSIDLSLSKTYFSRLALLASISQSVMDGDLLALQSSLGFDFKIIPDKNYHLKGSFGKSAQVPTLNDLYWVPGGNPDLKTESSMNSELSYAMGFNIGDKSLIRTELTAYRSKIEDMIVWQPLSASVWQPQNLNRVVSRGMELNNTFRYISGKHKAGLILGYALTVARKTNLSSINDLAVDKQLIYVPKHTGSLRLEYTYSRLKTSWWMIYTGKRYIASDNSESLPDYILNNCSVSLAPGKGRIKIYPGLSVYNIFATSYTNIIAYPMPMRSYRFTLSFKFESK